MAEIRNLNVSREQLMNLVSVSQEMMKTNNLVIIDPKIQRINTVNALGGTKKGVQLPTPPNKRAPTVIIQKRDSFSRHRRYKDIWN